MLCLHCLSVQNICQCIKTVNLMYYNVQTKITTFKSKTSTDADIKNTLKFARKLLLKSCYKTRSENGVLKDGLTTTFGI